MHNNKLGKTKPRAILVDLITPDTDKVKANKRLEELESLVKTFGGIVVVKTIQKRGVPDYDSFIGKGKVDEIIELALQQKANLLIVNNILKAKQIYNLDEIFRKKEEEGLKLKTWDRIDLILEIFSKHAQSAEAKLQIELSKIRHMGPRIFGMGEELSRQGGATGMRAGQGESNIEMMKRHLRRQELKILEKLKHYEKIREGHRKRRKKQNLKTAALVGYTNAGKSSLLNALTNKGAYVANKLFATLDTRVGKVYLKETEKFENGKFTPGEELLISDTIGFIQDLPPSLIKAFKSTLSETVDADVLLHVIDVLDPEIEMKIKVVEEILEELGLADKEKIYVFNKIDLFEYEYEDIVEDDPFNPDEPIGLVKAHKGLAQKLGWEMSENREQQSENIHYHDPKKLEKNYQDFDPVFISAHERINLEELVKKITSKIIT